MPAGRTFEKTWRRLREVYAFCAFLSLLSGAMINISLFPGHLLCARPLRWSIFQLYDNFEGILYREKPRLRKDHWLIPGHKVDERQKWGSNPRISDCLWTPNLYPRVHPLQAPVSSALQRLCGKVGKWKTISPRLALGSRKTCRKTKTSSLQGSLEGMIWAGVLHVRGKWGRSREAVRPSWDDGCAG